MKNQLLFLVTFLMAFLQVINAQCSRSGSFVQSDPAYSISGDANITFTTSGDKEVIFASNFATVQGLDLRVYLSKTDDILVAESEALEVTTGPLLGDNGMTSPVLSPISGMKSFTIPSAGSVELKDFDYIVIQCIGINERWGYVALGTNTGADCESLSVDDKELENISIFPNPSNGKFTIKAPFSKDAQISIFNILGGKVFSASQKLNFDLDLSSLKSGVYLTRIEVNGQQIAKRLIIK